MAGITVGEVHIKVRPNTHGFRQKVERDLADLRDVQLKVDPKTAGLRQKIERAADGARAKVKVDVDKQHLKGQMRKAEQALPSKMKTTMKVVANTSAAVKTMKGLENYLEKFSAVDVFDFNNTNGSAEQLQWKMLSVRQSLAKSTAEARNFTSHLPGKEDVKEIQRIGKALNRMFRKDYGTPNFADLPGIPMLRRQTRRWMTFMRSRSREAARSTTEPFERVGNVVERKMVSASKRAFAPVKRRAGEAADAVSSQYRKASRKVRRTADATNKRIRRGITGTVDVVRNSPKLISDSARNLGHWFGTEFEKGYNQRAEKDGFGGSLVEDVDRLRKRTRAARLEQQLLWDAASKATKRAQAEAKSSKKYSDRLSLLPVDDRENIEDRLMGRAKALRKLAKEYRRANKDWDGHKDFIRQQHALEESVRKLKDLGSADFRDRADGLLSNMQKQAEKLAVSRDKLDKFSDSVSRLKQAYHKVPDVQGPSLGPMEKQVREAIRLRREYEDASRLGKARIWARDNEHVQRLNRGLRKTVDYAKKAGPPIQRLATKIRGIDFKDKFSTGVDNARKWGRFLNPIRRIPDSVKRKPKKLFSGFRSGLSSLRDSIGDGVAGLRNLDFSFARVTRSARKTGRETKKTGGIFRKLRKFVYSGESLGTRILGLTSTGWIVAAIASIAAPAAGLIQGALMAIPSLALAGGAALGVLVAGFDGIKDAAQAAKPGLDELRNATSDVFRERLTPQFEQLGNVLSAITPNAVNVANGFSDFTQGMVDAISSSRGLGNIQKVMDRTGKMMSKLQPFANNFTDALLQAGEAGSRTFPLLTRQLNNFGRNFKKYIDTISEDGTLQRGVESTYRLLGSFGNNIGKILSSAFEVFPEAERGFTKLFDGLGDGLAAMMPAFMTFGNQIASVLGDITSGIGRLFDTIGPELQSVLNTIGPAFSNLLMGASHALLPVVDGFMSFLDGIGPGVADVFNAVGNSLSHAGDMLAQSNLVDGLRGIGENIGNIFSVISNNGGGFQLVNEKDIRVLNGFIEDVEKATGAVSNFFQTIEDKGAGQAFKDLGKNFYDPPEWKTEDIEARVGYLLKYEVKEEKPLGQEISNVKKRIKQAARSLEKVGIDIDVEPTIKALENAKTAGEVNRIVDDVSEKMSAAAAAKDIRPDIQVVPNLKVEDGIAQMQAAMHGPIAQLENFKAELGAVARSVGSDLKIDIEPQIEVLQKAGSTEEAKAALGDIVKTVSEAASAEGHEVKIPVEPKAEVSPATNIEGEMQAAIEPAKQSLTQAFQNMGADLNATTATELNTAMAQVDAAVGEAANGIGTSLGQALGGVEIDMSGFANQISTALGDVSTIISDKVQEIGTSTADSMTSLVTELGSSMQNIGTTIGDAMRSASESVGTAMTGISDSVKGALSGLPAEVGGYFSEIASSAETQGNAAKDSFISAMQAMKTEAVSTAGQIKSGVEAALKIDATSSGAAVGQTFANGIRSQIGNVSAAASELAAAARDKFPNSPAKEGPFSGSGWIDKSGDSVGIAFANGIRRQVKNVSDATTELAGAARAEFNDIATAPEATMKAYQKKKILDPVLKHNAEQFARYREANEQAEQRHAERLGEISKQTAEQQGKAAASVAKLKGKNVNKQEKLAARNASISEREAKKIAKADENLAKSLEKNRENLEKNLQTPDYTDINFSFNSYWVEGLKEMFKEKLGNLAHDTGLADKTRAAAREAVRVGRQEFGDHPIFAEVEANINSEHFEWAVEEAIRESGLNEVPINFVVDNLSQLKRDLNMGDGVVSRGIDQAMAYNFNDMDVKRYRDYKEKTEVHYHVEDMQEAIRLEQVRERKKMMKVR